MAKTIFIYDQIDPNWGYGMAQLKEDLKGISETEEITIRINSPGGSVFEGFAIYNYLKSLPNNKIVYIDGLSASIASLIMLAGNEVNASDVSMIMIHPPSVDVGGTEGDHQNAIDLLSKINDILIGAYSKNIGGSLTEDKLRELVDAETWMTAKEALDYGFIDKLVEPEKVAAILTNYNKSKMNFIDKLKAMADKLEANDSVETEEVVSDAVETEEVENEEVENVETTEEETTEEVENSIEDRVLQIENALETLTDLVSDVMNKVTEVQNSNTEKIEDVQKAVNSNITNKLNELGKKIHGKHTPKKGGESHPKSTNRSLAYREHVSKKKKEIEDRTRN